MRSQMRNCGCALSSIPAEGNAKQSESGSRNQIKNRKLVNEMNNAIARFGKTVVSMLVGGGILAGGLLAANRDLVTVSLPHAVTVGNATLPEGEYTIASLSMNGSDDMFVIRAEKGNAVAMLQGQKVLLPGQSDKTQVVLSKDGDNWSIDKLVIAGDGVSYQFAK
jgi:hypothetical protein